MLVFDIETNGLLYDVSKIHCIATFDTETEKTYVYNDQDDKTSSIRDGINQLMEADTLAGHNIIGYDLPVLRKLSSEFNISAKCVDTLVLSRLYHPNLMEIDKRRQWRHMPLQLYGRHSLEAYGYRLGEYKGAFGKNTDWQEWSQEMQDYMVQDVNVTTKLCEHFRPLMTRVC
tara:strand:+ start:2794 stop:3312 length:519 start_codon:yes stop_codon:yes gene_type:complete